MRILVADDDRIVADCVRDALEGEAFEVDVVHTAREAEAFAKQRDYAAIVLDMMFPDDMGVNLCRRLRHEGYRTPIVMFTAVTGSSPTVQTLEAGADDYLTKPVSLDVVVAHVRALIRRSDVRQSLEIMAEGVHLDLPHRVAHRNGKRVELTDKQFCMLEFLMQRRGTVASRIEIASHVWEQELAPSSNVIDVLISTLRKKIDRGFHPPLIRTVVGEGYRFGPASTPPAARPAPSPVHAAE